MNFILAYSLELSRFIVKLYHFENRPYIDQQTVTDLIDNLNTLETPKDVLEKLAFLDGIVKTEIFNLDNELLLCNSLVIE